MRFAVEGESRIQIMIGGTEHTTVLDLGLGTAPKKNRGCRSGEDGMRRTSYLRSIVVAHGQGVPGRLVSLGSVSAVSIWLRQYP
jgi:hypothetical protein